MEFTGLSDKGTGVLALESKDSNSTPQIKSHFLISEANSSYRFCPFMGVAKLHLEPFLPTKHQAPCAFKEPC